MTATNSTEPAKDGNGTGFNWTFAAESVSGNKAQKTYIGEPVGETLITPAQDGIDGTGITPPTGGSGIRGWLSGAYNTLQSILTGVTASIPAGSAVIGVTGVAQNSTSAGQSGPLAQAATLQFTGNTSYTAAKTNPLIANQYGGLITANCPQYVFSAPLVQAAAYTAGFCVGGVQGLSFSAQGGTIVGASLAIKSAQTATFVLYLFCVNPASSTFTDKAAPVVNTSDLLRCVGYITFTEVALSSTGLGNSTTIYNGTMPTSVGLPFYQTTAYYVLVAQTGVTFGSTTDIALNFFVQF